MVEGKQKRIVVGLGGSLLFDERGEFNTPFIQQVRDLIREAVAHGQQFIIIVGGGKICRKYQDVARALGATNTDALDWIGIASTHLNAAFLIAILELNAQPNILRTFEEPVDESFPIAVGGGVKPGSSKDYDACLWAVKVGASVIVRASNTPFVFDSDPRKNPQAKPLKNLTWTQYRTIIGGQWTPGLASPFDPVAAAFAAEKGLTVRFFDGRDIAAFKNALLGQPFTGSIIHP